MYYEATFEPSNPADYADEAEPLTGQKIPVQAGWILEEGPHRGEQCYYIPNTTIGTIPASHLQNIQPISYSKWREIHKHFGFDD